MDKDRHYEDRIHIYLTKLFQFNNDQSDQLKGEVFTEVFSKLLRRLDNFFNAVDEDAYDEIEIVFRLPDLAAEIISQREEIRTLCDRYNPGLFYKNLSIFNKIEFDVLMRIENNKLPANQQEYHPDAVMYGVPQIVAEMQQREQYTTTNYQETQIAQETKYHIKPEPKGRYTYKIVEERKSIDPLKAIKNKRSDENWSDKENYNSSDDQSRTNSPF